MALFLFILVVIAGGVLAFRLLAPDMYLRLNISQISRFNFPWQRPRLLRDAPKDHPTQTPIEELPQAIDVPLQFEEASVSLTEQLNKMESLLFEKNKTIDRLQKELTAERSHRNEFEKIKSIMDEEVLRLKDQVKTLKSSKEKSHA